MSTRIDWSPLRRELARWRREERVLPIWWRDDDAVAVTPALHQLASLSAELALSVHVAVIPKYAEPALAAFCADAPTLVPLVHGWAHQNNAQAAQKKSEFGHYRPEAPAETQQALDRLRGLFVADLLPVFVPPWNRISPDLIPHLAPQGYRALSTYTPRRAPCPAPGLLQINTHIDPIRWRGGGGLLDPERQIGDLAALLVERREGRQDNDEPLGLLSHHLVHDAAIWEFCRACLSELLTGGAVGADLRDMLGEAS
ncbi:polysaccharide deacetylase family protein [Sulfitobacter aestuarii]|uniref:Polysaccharide deacetylase family protein n=1 Tax=Sulfitobacter aestuarii TaxID=2161676 RepID=A0ABW5U541_9RHOB